MSEKEFTDIYSLLLKIQEDVKDIKSKLSKELLTPKEVCSVLKIGKTTYQRYVENNVFEQIKIQGKAYVKRSAIEILITEGKI